MICPACRSDNGPDACFCSRCGAALAAAPASLSSPQPSGGENSAAAGKLGAVPYSVVGYEMQAAKLQLGAGQAVLAEPGALLYMRGDVQMQTGTGGGLMAGFKRALAGDSFFLTQFSSNSSGELAFAAPYPGTIHPVEIGQTDWLCQRHSFLCCSPGVSVTIAFTQKLGYGMFSGEGFILQKLTGQGSALVHAGGHFMRMELQAGEEIRIDTGSVVAFDSRIAYRIEFVKGFKNVLFAGEGLFFIVLTGPGTVILQTLSFDRLVSRIAAQAGAQSNQAGMEVAGLGALGGILGGVLGGGGGGGSGSF